MILWNKKIPHAYGTRYKCYTKEQQHGSATFMKPSIVKTSFLKNQQYTRPCSPSLVLIVLSIS